jgi:hypothetical protein
MSSTIPRNLPIDARIYRAFLYLYPPQFRREFAEEMARDFNEATSEAQAARGGLVTFRARICADFLKTVLFQWARTGLPAIALVAAIVPLYTVTLLARLSQSTPVSIPTEPDAEMLAIVLLVTVVLLIVVSTILMTVLFVHPRLKRRAR